MIKITVKNPKKTRKFIASSGYSIRGFSKVIEVSHSYLSQVLNGKRNPSPVVAKKITDGLNKEVEEIFFIQSGS